MRVLRSIQTALGTPGGRGTVAPIPPAVAATEAPARQVVPAQGAPLPLSGDMVATSLLTVDRTPEPSREGDSMVHASSLARGPRCARMFALAQAQVAEGRLPPGETPTSAMRIVWAMGRAIETHVRQQIMASQDLGPYVWGDWRCPCGHTRVRGATLQAVRSTGRPCPACQRHASIYEEHGIASEEYGASGSPDLMIERGPRTLYIIEIKSISKTAYAALTRETRDHGLQVSLYRRLLEDAGYTITGCCVLYVAKDHVAGSPYRPFEIDPRVYQIAVDDSLEAARAAKMHREGGALPPRQMCGTPDDGARARCGQAGECFRR